jgi:hypothetical protein
MAITRCTLSVVRGRLIAAVNAAPAATWATTVSSSNDNRRNDTELDNIILAEDARICVARASRVGDGYRSLFLSLSASIAHGSVIPDCLGPPEQIMIQRVAAGTYDAGVFDASLTLADIERWRANIGTRYGAAHNAANSVISGYYIRRGKQLFYTGNDAKAQIANFVRSGACQAPETDESLLLGLALGSATKEGDTIAEFAPLIKDARAELALLLQGEPDPTITTVLAVGS